MSCVGSSSAAAAAAEAEAEAEQVARRALSARLAPLASDFTAQLAAVATLDAAAARARHAAALRGCRPQLLSLNSPKPLRVLGLRHPLLVETLEGPPWEPRRGAAPPPVVVPVDFSPPAGARVLLVSGSNAGGKTAACKAFALAALGARAGIFPAASAAALPWFDRVLTDVGEPQSLQAGLSTFSGRMRRLATLLRAATPRSLLLIDEVGSGTGAAEGGALGAALLEDCARGGVQLTLATSHSGALKALKHTAAAAAEEAGAEVGVSPFENAAAEFDAQLMAPTHRLLWGLPGRSRALDIALRLGMRAEVVAAARARLGERAAALEELLGGVEAARGTRRADEEAAREAREAAERDGRAVKGTLGRLDKAREALRKSTAREVAKIAEKAAQEIAARKRAEAGAEAARLKASAAAEAAAAVKVQEQAVKAAEAVIAAQRPAAPPAAWAVGQRVRVRLTPASLPLEGIVAAVQGGTLAVLVGSMQMRAPAACCELLPPAPPKAVPRSRRK